MKRIFLSLLFIITTLQSFAQYSVGSYVIFPDLKKWGINYKPRMAISKIGQSFYLNVCYKRTDHYEHFNSNSVLLLKFEDDSVDKLSILGNASEVYNCSISDYDAHLTEYYTTYTDYTLTDECLQKILDKKRIKKIRIVFTNGNFKDYDITPKYMGKMADNLIKSYEEVMLQDTDRNSIMQNAETGF